MIFYRKICKTRTTIRQQERKKDNPNAVPKSILKKPTVAQPETPVQQQQKPIEVCEKPPKPMEVQPQADIIKDAVITDAGDSEDVAMNDENGGRIPFKKIFQMRKKSSERARDKKIRQNRQLRKAMLPKNALMALNEVKGITISDFVINNNAGGGFTAAVTVNGRPYEGKGASKIAAKNIACEKALRDYIIDKMIQKPRKRPILDTQEPMELSEEVPIQQQPNSDSSDVEDLPMLNLASFAIYKLFSEWERDGYTIPELHPAAAQLNGGGAEKTNETAAVIPKKLPIRSELPPNWETMHPATLLCVMRPGIVYVDLGSIGEKPNVLQRLSINVDDQNFSAEGRSKKIARRNVAVDVCNTLFGTNFDREIV